MRSHLITLGAAAGLLLGALPEPASAAPKPGQPVTITGCPYPGVTGACLMMNGPDGTVYNITAIKPRPRPMNRMIRLRGIVTDKASICSQGIVLDLIRWTRTRRQCPN